MSAPERECEATARRWKMRDGVLTYVGRVPVPMPRSEGWTTESRHGGDDFLHAPIDRAREPQAGDGER